MTAAVVVANILSMKMYVALATVTYQRTDPKRIALMCARALNTNKYQYL